MTDLITKLLPILHVSDPGAERRFYEQLGLRTTHEGQEYPDFIAAGNEAVEFGLSRRPGADPATSGLTWHRGGEQADRADSDRELVSVHERPGGRRPAAAAEGAGDGVDAVLRATSAGRPYYRGEGRRPCRKARHIRAERRMLEARKPRHCRHCLGNCDGYCLLDDGSCIHGWNGNRPPVSWRAFLTGRWWNRVLWGEYGRRG